jgi:hypothetical protein
MENDFNMHLYDLQVEMLMEGYTYRDGRFYADNLPLPAWWKNYVMAPVFFISPWIPFSEVCWTISIFFAAAWLHTIYRFFLKDHINFTILFGLFYQSEQEPANLIDTKTIVSQIIFSSSLIMLVGWFLYRFPEQIASPTVLNILSWAICLLTLPALLSILFGTYILNYLKGDTESNSMLYAGVFDLSALLSFVIRFFVQLIRYVFIYAKMGLYLVCTEEMFRTKEVLDRIFKNQPSDVCLPLQIFDDICGVYYSLWHVVFEICNVVIVYYTQLGAFSLILFWLLKALYSHALPIVKFLWLKSN